MRKTPLVLGALAAIVVSVALATSPAWALPASMAYQACDSAGDCFDAADDDIGNWEIVDSTHMDVTDTTGTDIFFKYFSASGWHKEVTVSGGDTLVLNGARLRGWDVCPGSGCHFDVTDTSTDIAYIDNQ